MATVATMTFSGGGIKNSDISAGANIAGSKVNHQQVISAELAEAATAVAAINKLLWIAPAAGTLKNFEAIIVVQATGADRTVTVDLKKSTGGAAFATILSATIGFTNSSTILVPVVAVFSSDTFVAGDVFEAVVTVAGAAGNQAKGLLASLHVELNPVS